MMKKDILVFMQSNRFSYPIEMKLEYSWQLFEKYSNIKFHGNPSSVSRDVPFGRTDGKTWRS